MNVVLLTALLIGTALPLYASAREGKATTAVRTQIGQQEYPKIVIYSASWCPYCQGAIRYFNSRGIPYIEKDIEADADARKELAERYHTQGIPLIAIGDEPIVVRGFIPEKVEKALAKLKRK